MKDPYKTRRAMYLLRTSMTDEQYEEFKKLVKDLDLTVADVTECQMNASEDITPKYINK